MDALIDWTFADYVNWWVCGTKSRKKARHKRKIMRNVLREFEYRMYDNYDLTLALYGCRMYFDVCRILDRKADTLKNTRRHGKLDRIVNEYIAWVESEGVEIDPDVWKTFYKCTEVTDHP